MPIPDAELNAILDFANDRRLFVSIHDGDPGTTGANEITGGPYARVAVDFPAAAAAASEVEVEVLVGAGGPYTHFGLWSAASAGTFRGGAVLTPAETFAGPGSLLVTVNTTAAD